VGCKRLEEIGNNCKRHFRRNLVHGENLYPTWGESPRILGCPSGPDQANPTFAADATSLGADGEGSAFLWLKTAKPIRLLIVLHEQVQAIIASRYFSLERFELPVRYD